MFVARVPIIILAFAISGCQTVSSAFHFRAGTDALERGDYKLAAVELEKARSDNPNWSKIRNNLGVAYARLGRHDEAWREFLAAIAVPPENPGAIQNFEKYWGRFESEGVLAKGTPSENVLHRLGRPQIEIRCKSMAGAVLWLYGSKGLRFEENKLTEAGGMLTINLKPC
ncbi:MAG: tetratricopeptide repeat protein [Nitrospirae bacterium]|nr:MAG: tetratricopeptide repeat protein [Nitrospirota bacterium]